jgi:hypothetical protein
LAARGRWIAFLDDDDLWYAEKTQAQISRIGVTKRNVLVVARATHVDETGSSQVFPTKRMRPGEQLMEYVLRSPTAFSIAGFILDTVLIDSETAKQELFDETLLRLEDFEWLIRIHAKRLVDIFIVWEPLAVVRAAPRARTPGRQSTAGNVDILRSWALETVRPVSRRYYYNFLLSSVLRQELQNGRRREAARVLLEAIWPKSSLATYISAVVLLVQPWSARSNWFVRCAKKAVRVARRRIDVGHRGLS